MRAALVVAALLPCAACGRSGAGPGRPTAGADAHALATAASPEHDAMPPARVILQPPGGREAAVRVSLARAPAERERGLMFVQNLPLDDGMLFLFDTDEVQAFWMKNTLISLDMIFIRADLSVAGVVARAEPLTLTARTVHEPSRYVLEVNGGWAAAHGVGAGTRVRFEGFTP